MKGNRKENEGATLWNFMHVALVMLKCKCNKIKIITRIDTKISCHFDSMKFAWLSLLHMKCKRKKMIHKKIPAK